MPIKKVDFSRLADNWKSAWVARTQIDQFTGGIVSEKYAANLDCLGKGPRGRLRVGRKIAYPVAEVIRWLESRATEVKGRHPAE